MSAENGQTSQAVSRLLGGDQVLLDKLLTSAAPRQRREGRPVAREYLAPLVRELALSTQGLRTQLDSQLEALDCLAPADAALLDLVDTVLEHWQLQLPLDARLLSVLRSERGALASLALATDGWLTDAQHPLYRFLDLWTEAGLGWHSDLGRGAERWMAQLETSLHELRGCAQRTDIDAALLHLADTVNREQQRLARLEQRLRDSEQGQLQARRARQLAARLLNQKMGGRRLPAEVTQFLQEDCYRCLQQVALTEGSDGPRWQTVARSLETLVTTLQPIDDDSRQQRYQLIPHCADSLREALAPLFADGAALESQLAMIEAQHLILLKGGELEYSAFELIANHDPLLANTSISRDLLNRVKQLNEGHWFLCESNGGEQRLRLCFKLEESQQLLFVNQLGVKAAQYSYEEFAYQIATGQARHLRADGQLLAQTELALAELYERAVSNQQARKQAMEDARRKQEEQAQQRQLAKEKAMAEAKAHQEALDRQRREQREAALASERSRRETAVKRHGATDDQRQQQVRALVSALRTGDWVHRYDELGNRQRLKLAVDLPSTGKLIFVDHHGVKQWDSDRSRIGEELLNGSVELLSKSAQFEDTLAKVVGDLRRSRTQRNEEP